MSQERTIFKNGSTTFFMSSLFFPRAVRTDVFDLYSFVRVADDYVDQIPANSEAFYHLRRLWSEAVADPDFDISRSQADSTDERVIKNMIRVARKRNFEMAWIESFLDAMQADVAHKHYETINDTLGYIYGSGEVIGLMMAHIMELETEARKAAQMQGRALQIINFIRDITEDNQLGRQYLPHEDLERFNLADLSYETAQAQSKDFTKFIHFQLDRYETWQVQARAGYKYIPRRLRIPLQTAADMYGWTAAEIRKNPLVVYERKVKPGKARVIYSLLTNKRKFDTIVNN